MHKVTFSGSAEQGMARELFTAHMKKALEKRPGLADARKSQSTLSMACPILKR